jgi:protein-L-isoaspartate(D-aspartate) O-methyltransferase
MNSPKTPGASAEQLANRAVQPRGPAMAKRLVDAGLATMAPDRARVRMVEGLKSIGVRDAQVLEAMQTVPRHVFVEDGLASRAYEDSALPIGFGQTISKPSTVARMLELVLEGMSPERRSAAHGLEIGTGCGYQAAVLAQMIGDVVSIERLRELHEQARSNLRPFRQPNLRLVYGDGRLGAQSAAPFDVVVVAAAADAIADPWLLQLKVGGRLIAPVKSGQGQVLQLVERSAQDQWQLTSLDAVRFVPLKAGTR